MKRKNNGEKVSSMSLQNNDNSSSSSKANKPKLPAFGSEKVIKDQSSVKFQRIRFESPDGSANLDASEHRDLFSKSGYETPFVSPKEQAMIEKDLSLSMMDKSELSGEQSDPKKSKRSSGLRILVTPAAGGQQAKENVKNPVPSFNSLPTLKESTLKEKIKHFLGIKERRLTIHLVGDQIKKKQQMFSERHSGGPKVNNGRLLQIIADQALNGRNAEVSKAFRTALMRINVGALERAQLMAQRKKRRSRNIIQGIRRFFHVLVGPWRPDSSFIGLWNILVLASILITAFLSPLIIVFLQTSSTDVDSTILLLHLIVDIVYLLSVLVNFRTAYYHHGELKTHSRHIMLNYLKSGLITDVISELAIIGRVVSGGSNLKYLGFLALLRIYRVPNLINSIEDYFQFNRQIKTIVEVSKLVVVVFILAHWFGCIFYAITRVEQHESNWLDTVAGVQAGDMTGYYVAALYWALMTMSTVGYGDIAPITTKERILTVIIMLISSIIFGFLLSSIGSLLLELSRFSSESREKIRSLNKYMNDKGLNKDIQSKIRKYLEFYLDKENAVRQEGDNIIQLLSQNLKDEIIKEVNAKILNDIYMFSFNFRKKFLYLISRDFTEKSYGPDEVIFQHNDQDDCSVFFIMSGRVEIYYDKSDLSLQKIDKGKSFGFLSFFSGQPRSASAKSLEFTTVFILGRAQFLSKLEEFHTEKEMYTMIKDSINLYNSYQYLNIKCYSCGSRDHIALNCHKVHFKFNHQKIIARYLAMQKRLRETFIRGRKKKFRALEDFEPIQEAVAQHQLIQQNELYFDNNDDLTEGEQTEVRSYSSIDDVMDRNLYDLQPLVCATDTVHFRIYNFNDPNDITVDNSISSSKKIRSQKKKKTHATANVGEVEAFISMNYDRYYHNISLDRIKNFEVYHPNNNIIKLMVDFEKVRLQKIVEMRLGVGKGAHHLTKLLIKGFRAHERHHKDPTVSSVGSARSMETEKRHSHSHHVLVDPSRRHSVSVNPSDIAMYGTISRHMNSNSRDSSPNKTPPHHHHHAGGLYTLLKVPHHGKSEDTPKSFPSSSPERQANRRNRGRTGISSIDEENSLELVSSARKRGHSKTHIPRPSVSSQSSDYSQSGAASNNGSIPDSSRNTYSKSHLSRGHAGKPQSKKKTAQFGSQVSDSPQLHRPSISLMVKPRASVPVNLFQPNTGRKAVMYTETGIGDAESDYREQKKPIALFDFTQLVKKMTVKLEENSKSPLHRTASGASGGSNLTNLPSLHLAKKPAPKKSLFVEILHRQNSRFVERKKGRSSSQGGGEEVTSLIQKYGLEEILDTQ